jgi:hypothetical protein
LLVPFSDIVIDNTSAVVVGTNWNTGTSSVDKFGANYRFSTQGTGTNYLRYVPDIPVAGYYLVSAWYPLGGNRTTNAPYVINYNGGSQTIRLNQQTNGGQWNLLGQFNFAAGTSGDVRITDALPDPPKVVLADAIKLVYVQPPVITFQPRNLTAKAGSNVTFTVTSTGTPPLQYQWFLKGSNIFNSTSNSSTLANIHTNNAGNYFVTVSNIAGAVSSSNALLSVTIPLPAHIDSFKAAPDGAVRLSISGEPGSPYVIQNSSNLVSWADLAMFVSTNGTFQYTNNVTTNVPASFYRIRLGQ